MNFEFSQEQQMLKDSVARFVQDEYGFEARNKVVANEAGFSQDNWNKFAELGWLSIPFSEELGGFGGGPVDIMMVMEEFGRGLVAEPFVATVLMFGGLLNTCNDDELKEELIAKIIEGQLQGAVAFAEPQSRFELADVTTTAVANDSGFILNGRKSLVLNAMSADKLIVSARVTGEQFDEGGIGLFILDASAAGVERTSLRLMDGQVVATIDFDDAQAQPICEVGDGLALLKTMSETVMIAQSAEAVGIMQKLNATTIEYVKTRKQFGVAIGSFQALQHRMVDMFAACEQAKSMIYRAVCIAEDGRADFEVTKNIAALKVKAGQAGRLIGSEAMQLHGGMGMTDELDVGHFAKRLMMLNMSFGDMDYHQQRFIEMSKAS